MLTLAGCVGLDNDGREAMGTGRSMSSSSTGGVTLGLVTCVEVKSVSPNNVSTGGGDQFVGTWC